MKTAISRHSHTPKKRYSGVYQQQGRMVTDADWNELMDMVKRRLDDVLQDVVGSGAPRERGVEITDGPEIANRYLYGDGVVAVVAPADPAHPEGTPLPYDQQADFPAPPALPAGDYRLYGDIWERTVDYLEDSGLLDPGLHGADTTTRTQTMGQIKWCPAGVDPEDEAENPRKGNAGLTLTLHQKQSAQDPCDPCAELVSIDERVGNYLFRVEVHDVKGAVGQPTELTLKWSRENGAEKYKKGNVPSDFKAEHWVYEFYEEQAEKHLGVHLAGGFAPTRGQIVHPFPDFFPPNTTHVRRWDGYAVLKRSGAGVWSLATDAGTVLGRDKNVELSTGGSGSAHGHVTLGTRLGIRLENLKLDLALGSAVQSREFVAGDYWLATVRENNNLSSGKVFSPDGSAGFANQPPLGITHHYLLLADVGAGGAVQEPETPRLRKLNFPPLTDLQAYDVGYGTDCEPEHDGPLFDQTDDTVKKALDKICHLAARNIAYTTDCEPEHAEALFSATEDTVKRALDKICEIAAKHIGYEPGCNPEHAEALFDAGDNTVKLALDKICEIAARNIAYTANCEHGLFEGFEGSVKEALDQICDIRARHVGYTLPKCQKDGRGLPTAQELFDLEVAPWPDMDGDGRTTLDDIVSALLCHLEARTVPYDYTKDLPRWRDLATLRERIVHKWSFNLGNKLGERGLAVALDPKNDDIVFAGYFSGKMKIGATELNGGDESIFLAKFRKDGRPLQAWSFPAGNPGGSAVAQMNLAVDREGNIVLTGTFNTDVKFGRKIHSGKGANDFFVAKFDGGGTRAWSHAFYGDALKSCTGVRIDGRGDVFLTGHFRNKLFFDSPALGPLLQQQAADFFDIFVVKLTKRTGLPMWKHNFSRALPPDPAATAYEVSHAITLDQDGNAVLTGWFASNSDFGGGPLAAPGQRGVFAMKLHGESGKHLWSRGFPTSTAGSGYGVATDALGDVFVTGQFWGKMTGLALPLVSAGISDGFLMKLRAGDGEPVWAHRFGGAKLDEGTAVVADSEGNAVLAGFVQGAVEIGEMTLKPAGTAPALFGAVFGGQTGLPLAARLLNAGSGSIRRDLNQGLSLDSEDNLVLGGTFSGELDFDGGVLKANGPSDLFLAKFGREPILPDTVQKAIDTLLRGFDIMCSVPPGTVIAYASPLPPKGWLECNGQQVSREEYRVLYEAIGTRFGSADDLEDFNVPDLRGQFVRGWDHGEGNDPDSSQRFALHTGGQTGDSVGTYQVDALQNHKHNFNEDGTGITITGGSHNHYDGTTGTKSFITEVVAVVTERQTGLKYNASGVTGTRTHTHSFTPTGAISNPTSSRTANETRPKNLNLMYIIKY